MNGGRSSRRSGSRSVLRSLDNVSRRIVGGNETSTSSSTPVQNRNCRLISRNASRRDLNGQCSPISRNGNRVAAVHSAGVQSAVKKTVNSISRLANLSPRRIGNNAQIPGNQAQSGVQDEKSPVLAARVEIDNAQAVGQSEQVVHPTSGASHVEAVPDPNPAVVGENPPPYNYFDWLSLNDTFDLLERSNDSRDDNDDDSDSSESYYSDFSSVNRSIVSSPRPTSNRRRPFWPYFAPGWASRQSSNNARLPIPSLQPRTSPQDGNRCLDYYEPAPWALDPVSSVPGINRRNLNRRLIQLSPYRSREYYWRPMDSRTPPRQTRHPLVIPGTPSRRSRLAGVSRRFEDEPARSVAQAFSRSEERRSRRPVDHESRVRPQKTDLSCEHDDEHGF